MEEMLHSPKVRLVICAKETEILYDLKEFSYPLWTEDK